MRLKEALSVLSKSSPYSVSTLRKGQQPDEYKYKEYLYIEPQIAIDLERALNETPTNSILFLCGSSGDGKSEVLTRLYNKPEFQNVVFHLDATHGKTQHGTAVESLDELFDKQKKQQHKLAVGINIGMFQKFIKFGSDKHSDIKVLFSKFLENRHEKGYQIENAYFYDFESYPRLHFDKSGVKSEFVFSYLKKLTKECGSNPFYELYISEKEKENQIAYNFQIISLPEFQSALVYLFGLIRLHDEQFLIPRLFVDFIYQLITTENDDGIIGNLFTCLDNQLSEKIVGQDPLQSSSQKLDSFLLALATGSLSENTLESINYLQKMAGCKLSKNNIIRFAWVLNKELGDLYPESELNNLINNEVLESYCALYEILVKSEFNDEEADLLIGILEENLLADVANYVNRKVNTDVSGFVISRELKDFAICNKVEAEIDLDWLEENRLTAPDIMPIRFLVNGDEVVTLKLDIKVFTLIKNIQHGYLPNRNLHNEYTKLEEFISELIAATSKAKEVRIIDKKAQGTFYAEAKKSRRGYTVVGDFK
ncbi:DNA phosphorothioation-dependent restriction protein DptF [Pseudoalteromonas sp. B530]|uniref:DNA phosphorothioation-dependent restriction protein DptF n=1 Tax=Pseudoalteromonas sp. B530 TaxID=2994390 RepID=UPI00224AB80C|nr:DNA phosphorothioation-dependent restriction protein DptF [Pseudoalteromonas sp. B530]MCX2767112.1 DNA phosphorothioation-dependent restriction protein DptF [Pseudoalteromonas sp. B530]